MIDLRLDSDILEGDLIYNPTENVRYQVMSYPHNMDFDIPVAYLRPFPPFGTSKKEFTMTIQAMIDLKYKLIKQRRV